MDADWVLTCIRLYFECGVVVGIFLCVLSVGTIKVSELLLSISFWPMLVLVMMFFRSQDDGGEE